MYSYVVNNPLAFTDPDGKAAVAVNFVEGVPVVGHEGIAVIHDDGSATYARYGPVGGSAPYGPGKVSVVPLSPVHLVNGLPTDASYKQLAQEVADIERQPASTVGFNYFMTSEAESISLEQWMYQMKALSDRGAAPDYQVNTQNCATFTLAGLLRAGAIQNSGLSIVPNSLFMILWTRAAENYTWQGRKKPDSEPDRKAPHHKPCLIDPKTGKCAS